MPIFNSLGSNYQLKEVLTSCRQLLGKGDRSYQKIAKQLEQFYQGKAVFLFNGRDAIEYCLEAYGINSGDQVLTQAFSCSSIEESIQRVGAKAVYFDLMPDKITTSSIQIKEALHRAKNPKAVILQHTLGYPDEVDEVVKLCQQKGLILIADLAQAVGAVGLDGSFLGLESDAIILSFGRDKILDAVVGGAVIFRETKSKPEIYPPVPCSKKNLLLFHLYPCLTLKIRFFYNLGVGKFLHWLCLKIKLISTSIKSPHYSYEAYPKKFSRLLLDRWKYLNKQLEHRCKIAIIYFKNLKNIDKVKFLVNQVEIEQGTNLRFPLLLDSKKSLQSLTAYLADHGVYVSDRWYRQPVDSGSLDFETDYILGSCPEAERLSKRVINLPTHQNLNSKQAEKISKLIINWSKL